MNNRRLLNWFFCICSAIFISSCGINSKKAYLESFENFIVKIEKAKKLSDDEITTIKKDYLDFTETYYNKYENELLDSEKDFILELKARYYAVLAKQGLRDFGDSLKELGEQASGFINDILE